MSEIEAVERRLWTEAGFIDDDWSRTDDAEQLSGNGRIILPLAAFLALDDETRSANAERIGVHLEPGDAIDAILPHLATLPMISLGFPAYNDGRSYSKAELLRSRHGYQGALRASGDVLIDQVRHMLRTGFSELEVTNETVIRRLSEGRPGGIDFYFQPTGRKESAGEAYSWRRRAAG